MATGVYSIGFQKFKCLARGFNPNEGRSQKNPKRKLDLFDLKSKLIALFETVNKTKG